MTNEIKRLLTVPDVAERYQVSEATVHRWVSQGKLGKTTVGRLVRFSERQLEEFEKRGEK